MRTPILLATLIALIGFSAVRPRSAAADEVTRLKKDEVVSRGFGKPRMRGYELHAANATLRPTGDQHAGLTYGAADGKRAFSLEIRWLERPRAGTEPARDWSIGPFGSAPDRYWHPRKQVRVHFKDLNLRDGLELDTIQAFAVDAADQVADRARPWLEPLASLALEPALHGYRLVRTHSRRDSAGYFVTEFHYHKISWRSLAEGLEQRLDRQVEILFRWFPQGERPTGKDENYWRYHPMAGLDEIARTRVFGVNSRTHYIRGQLRGEHAGDPAHFADREHLDEGIRIAETLRQRIEARLAELRAGTAAGDLPSVVERPEREADTNRASGTISSLDGNLTVFRGGRRVNLRQGSRVQQGDTLITGGGAVVVTFDDPTAGPASNGILTIGIRSKVTIDVGPYRPKTGLAPTRIRVEEGGVRFQRPHHHTNPRVELAIAGDVAIFGLTGTDAVLGRDGDAYLLILRDGLGDLALRGTHHKVLVPITAYAVGADGSYLWDRQSTAEQFEHVHDQIVGRIPRHTGDR